MDTSSISSFLSVYCQIVLQKVGTNCFPASSACRCFLPHTLAAVTELMAKACYSSECGRLYMCCLSGAYVAKDACVVFRLGAPSTTLWQRYKQKIAFTLYYRLIKAPLRIFLNIHFVLKLLRKPKLTKTE